MVRRGRGGRFVSTKRRAPAKRAPKRRTYKRKAPAKRAPAKRTYKKKASNWLRSGQRYAAGNLYIKKAKKFGENTVEFGPQGPPPGWSDPSSSVVAAAHGGYSNVYPFTKPHLRDTNAEHY
jgi:hypothetical protein